MLGARGDLAVHGEGRAVVAGRSAQAAALDEDHAGGSLDSQDGPKHRGLVAV
jgi:hypothetical protein